MNFYFRISLAGIAMLSCPSPILVCARRPHGFIDYRHGYLDNTRTHADRAEFGTFFSNGIGLIGELHYNTDEGDKDKWDPSQSSNNGIGLSVVYRFKPLDDKELRLEPMFRLDTMQYWPIYEYGLSASYDFGKEWKVSGWSCYNMDKTTDKSRGCGNDDHNDRRYDVQIDYRPQETNLQYQSDLIYYNNGYLTWNDGRRNHTVSLKIGYKIGSQISYISIADYKDVDKISSNRQIRWCWGLTYTL